MAARIDLSALMGAPQVFEHELVVVARAGDAQLECAVASEPLAFAHANVSDEYALVLPTGDPLLDAAQARTFLTDLEGRDVGRYRHGTMDLVLHPYGYLHWPGKLRPPYQAFEFPPGTRRRGMSLVACCSSPRAPGERPLGARPEGRSGDVVNTGAPMFLADVRTADPGVLAVVGDAVLELVPPGEISAPRGGARVLLEEHAIVHLQPGEKLASQRRALLFHSPTADAAPPPPPPGPPPFAPYEDAAPGRLPIALGAMTIDPEGTVQVGALSARVPRKWLARTLFREALHGLRLGYVETYEGFFCDDRDPAGFALGLRGAPPVLVPRPHALAELERLYRAVAPEGYSERLPP